MSQDDDVERVGRALAASDAKNGRDPHVHYSDYRDNWNRMARAAISALTPQGDGLAELRALSEKATPGMWKAEQWGDGSSHVDSLNVVAPDSEVVLAADMFKGDAAFIVACVNHVRAEIERRGK